MHLSSINFLKFTRNPNVYNGNQGLEILEACTSRLLRLRASKSTHPPRHGKNIHEKHSYTPANTKSSADINKQHYTANGAEYPSFCATIILCFFMELHTIKAAPCPPPNDPPNQRTYSCLGQFPSTKGPLCQAWRAITIWRSDYVPGGFHINYPPPPLTPRSHQTFRPISAVKLLGIMFRIRCWLTTVQNITAGDADGWCLNWPVWFAPH